jgi:hypothetical protein
MAPNQRGLLHSDLRRKKRRAAAKMLQAQTRIRDALYVLETAANELAIAYERECEWTGQREANRVVNALRDKNIFNLDGQNIFGEILPLFNSLPED